MLSTQVYCLVTSVSIAEHMRELQSRLNSLPLPSRNISLDCEWVFDFQGQKPVWIALRILVFFAY
jgi:hypothetical protein